MYEQVGLQSYCYMMVYGAVLMFAIVAAVYLMLRQYNVISSGVKPPKKLTNWATVFLISVAMSHVWWTVLGNVWLTEDRFLRNAINIMLDSITLVPLMMTTLLCMLQDKHRPLWPIFTATIPVIVICVWVGMINRNPLYETLIRDYLLLQALAFAVYMVFAVRRYGKWLHDNYADLEHKELWKSFVLLFILILLFLCYKVNFGGFGIEFAVQVISIVLIGFLLWRVESLEQLEDTETEEEIIDGFMEEIGDEIEKNTNSNLQLSQQVVNEIQILLTEQCEKKQLYLQYDITLNALCAAIGTNRTYLSAFFAQKGTNYNIYINRLRIEHFMSLYREYKKTNRPILIKGVAYESGFQSYRTFTATFKRIMNITASEWCERNG